MNSVFVQPPKCCCLGAKKFQAFVVIAVFTAAARATNLDVQWDNGAGNNDWGNPANWSGNVLPSTGLGTTGDKIHINLSGASRAIYSAATGTNIYQLIRIADSASGELQVTGGSLSSDSTTVTYIANGGQTATLNQSGGTINFGGCMEVGLGANSVGNINLTGGTLISGRNGMVGEIPSDDGNDNQQLNQRKTFSIVSSHIVWAVALLVCHK